MGCGLRPIFSARGGVQYISSAAASDVIFSLMTAWVNLHSIVIFCFMTIVNILV